jgi:WxcM-like protein
LRAYVVLAFANELYDPNDYIRDYDEFVRLELACGE